MDVHKEIRNLIDQLEILRFQINNRCADLETLLNLQAVQSQIPDYSLNSTKELDLCVQTMHIAIDHLYSALSLLNRKE